MGREDHLAEHIRINSLPMNNLESGRRVNNL